MKKIKKILIRIVIIIIAICLCIISYTLYNNHKIESIINNHPITETTTINNTSNITTGIQQIMLGSLCNNYDNALTTLKNIKNSGYEAIELNEFMIHDTGFLVKAMTKLSGMPIGNSGKLDWYSLIQESGLKVSSLHADLNTLETDIDSVISDAKAFNTNRIVITGMYQFDYSDYDTVLDLANRLNKVGQQLKEVNIELLYHNHNCELQKLNDTQTAYDVIIENTNEEYVNFELDTYWMIDGGANIEAIMTKLGNRMKMWHINDRGHRESGPYTTQILKENAMELGYGNIDLVSLVNKAKENGCDTVILETHQNWINDDPIESLKLSRNFFNNYIIN